MTGKTLCKGFNNKQIKMYECERCVLFAFAMCGVSTVLGTFHIAHSFCCFILRVSIFSANFIYFVFSYFFDLIASIYLFAEWRWCAGSFFQWCREKNFLFPFHAILITNDRLSEKKWTFICLQAISHFPGSPFIFAFSINTLMRKNEQIGKNTG